MIQILNFEQADEARKLTDCSHNHVLHGLVKLRRESDETGRVRQRADASFPGHPDAGVVFWPKSMIEWKREDDQSCRVPSKSS